MNKQQAIALYNLGMKYPYIGDFILDYLHGWIKGGFAEAHPLAYVIYLNRLTRN